MHARGTEREYVEAAIKAGFDKIGFSDHSPWPFENGFVSGMRMSADKLDDYAETILSLKEEYKDKIEIYLGLECEYFKKYIPWLCAMIEKYGLDYVILGHHFCTNEIGGDYNGNITTPKGIEKYTSEVLEAIDSGLFSYVAHPDIYMRGYPRFDAHCEKAAREIIQKAIETDTPLEYNLLGISHGKADGKVGYPHPEFWKIAGEMGVTAVIGVDAHFPDAYLDINQFEEAKERLRSLGIKTAENIKMFK